MGPALRQSPSLLNRSDGKDGGPTAIRTRVTSSASSCDIQATLWVQWVLDRIPLLNLDGLCNHIVNGRIVFHLGSASFFEFGPSLTFLVLCKRTPCIPSTENLTLSSNILSISARVVCSESNSVVAESVSSPSFWIARVLPSKLALGEKSKSWGLDMTTLASTTSRSRIVTFVISMDLTMPPP